MKSSYKYMFLLAGAFVLGVAAGNTVSLQTSSAQGYEGLIAPDKPAQNNDSIYGYLTKRDKDEGYQSPVLSQPQQPGSRMTKEQFEFARRFENRPRVMDMPEWETANYPGGTSPIVDRPPTLDDINVAAFPKLEPAVMNVEMIPEPLRKTMSQMISPYQKEMIKNQRPMMINGMEMNEYTGKRRIDQIMSFVIDPRLTPVERSQNVRRAREKLERISYSARVEATMPDAVYQVMDLPDNYVSRTRRASNKVFQYSEAALKYLEKFE